MRGIAGAGLRIGQQHSRVLDAPKFEPILFGAGGQCRVASAYVISGSDGQSVAPAADGSARAPHRRTNHERI